MSSCLSLLVLGMVFSSYASAANIVIQWSVDINDQPTFLPEYVINLGDSLTFEWDTMNEYHNVVSGPRGVPNGKFFLYSPGTVTFSAANGYTVGTSLEFVCDFHSSMSSKVTIQATPSQPTFVPAFNQQLVSGQYNLPLIFKNFNKKKFFASSPVTASTSSAAEIEGFIEVCKTACSSSASCKSVFVQEMKKNKKYKCILLTDGGASMQAKGKKSGLSFVKQ